MNKVHIEVAKLAREGYDFIMIGHKGHPEVEGTMGQLDHGIYLVEDVADVERLESPGDRPLAVVTQTTLSVDDAAEILGRGEAALSRTCASPSSRTSATPPQNRQDAVKVLAPGVDVLVVVGSPSSSNSNRLRELAERLGADAYMVDTADDLRAEWFEGKRRVGLTAGASAPEILVQAGRRAAARARRGLGAQPCRARAGDGALPAADGPRRQGDARCELVEAMNRAGRAAAPNASARCAGGWKVSGCIAPAAGRQRPNDRSRRSRSPSSRPRAGMQSRRRRRGNGSFSSAQRDAHGAPRRASASRSRRRRSRRRADGDDEV